MSVKFLYKMLEYYGLTSEDYDRLAEPPTLGLIPITKHFRNVEFAVVCLEEHIKRKDKIVVYGDYDCDGILATSIIIKALDYLHYENKGFYIPSRYTDGYGLTLEKAKQFQEKGYKLVICVDNGVSQNEAVNYCIDNGIDVIICDHHTLPAELPHTKHIIHPEFSKIKPEICSGGFCAYIFATAFLRKHDDYLLALAGISTISDLMQLTKTNREIVRYSLKLIDNNSFEPILLLNNYSIFTDESTIGGLIAPKINSVGRLQEGTGANKVVTFFTTDDEEERLRILKFIEANNNERKEITKNYSSDNDTFKIDKPCIFNVTSEKEGIIGLIASKLCNDFNKLAIVLTNGKNEKEHIYKSSIRSKPGINVSEMLENSKDLLLGYGGHEGAGGCSIDEANLKEFEERCYDFCKDKTFVEEETKYIEIYKADFTKAENYYILRNFAPFGQGNKRPKFIMKNFTLSDLVKSADGKHIVTFLGPRFKIVKFFLKEGDIPNKKIGSLYGTIGQNEFKGKRTLNFYIEKIV
ncbi:MAG: DHHA1 domain-containing protein [Bacilli bacterium]